MIAGLVALASTAVFGAARVGPGGAEVPDSPVHAAPLADPGVSPSPSASVSPSAPASVDPSDALVVPRVPTTEAPLRVWIAGDSLWEVTGPLLAGTLEADGLADATVEVRYSTGLTRPDVFDWRARVDEVVASEDPEMVLFLVGANDAQRLATDRGVLEPDSAAFAEVYGERVHDVMQRLTRRGARVLWVGLPIMRPAGYDAAMRRLTELHASVAQQVPGVTYVATRPLFADTDGAYTAVLPDEQGELQSVRGGDGIHLSRAGADRLARVLVQAVANEGVLPTP